MKFALIVGRVVVLPGGADEMDVVSLRYPSPLHALAGKASESHQTVEGEEPPGIPDPAPGPCVVRQSEKECMDGGEGFQGEVPAEGRRLRIHRVVLLAYVRLGVEVGPLVQVVPVSWTVAEVEDDAGALAVVILHDKGEDVAVVAEPEAVLRTERDRIPPQQLLESEQVEPDVPDVAGGIEKDLHQRLIVP